MTRTRYHCHIDITWLNSNPDEWTLRKCIKIAMSQKSIPLPEKIYIKDNICLVYCKLFSSANQAVKLFHGKTFGNCKLECKFRDILESWLRCPNQADALIDGTLTIYSILKYIGTFKLVLDVY